MTKRYSVHRCDYPDSEGEWVKYQDHVLALEAERRRMPRFDGVRLLVLTMLVLALVVVIHISTMPRITTHECQFRSATDQDAGAAESGVGSGPESDPHQADPAQ